MTDTLSKNVLPDAIVKSIKDIKHYCENNMEIMDENQAGKIMMDKLFKMNKDRNDNFKIEEFESTESDEGDSDAPGKLIRKQKALVYNRQNLLRKI